MKKQSGFTLIELVVAMAVLGLIMGAMVHLFGSSVTSLHVGARQEVVYEEARLLMNELKTTLRYADKDSINPQNPDDKTTTFSYSGTMWNRHMDIGATGADNIPYDIKVEWLDAGGGLKQLKVTRTDNLGNSNEKKKVIIFPEDSANSLFKGGVSFPITSEFIKLNDGNSVIMYKIALPLQYEFNGQMKIQTLETKVVPSEDEVTETPEEKMRREYMEILNIGLKIENGEKLSDKDRLKSLDTKPMQSRCTVQKHRMFFDYIFQNIPNSSSSTFYHAFCTFDISSLTAVNQAFHDKRLKQFQRHFFRQTTLMHFQFRPYYNNRTTGIVNTFT